MQAPGKGTFSSSGIVLKARESNSIVFSSGRRPHGDTIQAWSLPDRPGALATARCADGRMS